MFREHSSGGVSECVPDALVARVRVGQDVRVPVERGGYLLVAEDPFIGAWQDVQDPVQSSGEAFVSEHLGHIVNRDPIGGEPRRERVAKIVEAPAWGGAAAMQWTTTARRK